MSKFWSRRFAIALGFCFSSLIQQGFSAFPKDLEPELAMAFLLDIDGNAFNLPTKIYVYDDQDRETALSTTEFAIVEHQLGKPGTHWEKFKLSFSLEHDSMREFSDVHPDGLNNVLLSFIKGLAGDRDGKMKGPSFDAFKTALSHPITAKNVWLITARHNSPESILETLKYAKYIGWIDDVPELDKIWPVGHPEFEARFERVFGVKMSSETMLSTSSRKAAVMEQSLDFYQQIPLPKLSPIETRSYATWNSEGTAKTVSHLWGFSDDTLANTLGAIQRLQPGVNADRWSRLKITQIFTG